MKQGDARDIRVRCDIQPGDLGRIVALHGELYAREYGFDERFEAYVACTLGAFVSESGGPNGRLWIAEVDDQLLGCVGAVLQDDRSAQLRWLVVHPDIRGIGLGRTFVQRTIAWAADEGCATIFLWTVHPLAPAIRLYESCGFQLAEETETRPMWGCELREQRWERRI